MELIKDSIFYLERTEVYLKSYGHLQHYLVLNYQSTQFNAFSSFFLSCFFFSLPTVYLKQSSTISLQAKKEDNHLKFQI